jgi:hypothetical protein
LRLSSLSTWTRNSGRAEAEPFDERRWREDAGARYAAGADPEPFGRDGRCMTLVGGAHRHTSAVQACRQREWREEAALMDTRTDPSGDGDGTRLGAC